MMRRGVAATGLVVVLLAACAPAEEVPSQEAVAELLDAAFVERAEPEELCELGTTELSCRESLAHAPPAPEEAPTLECSDEFDAPDGFADGRLLRVTGEGSDGSSYDATLLAITTVEGPRFIDPVYWSAAGITTSGVAPSEGVELRC